MTDALKQLALTATAVAVFAVGMAVLFYPRDRG